jgi:hypothetical protein
MSDMDAKSALEIATSYLEKIAERGIGWSNYVDERRTHFLTDGELAERALAIIEPHRSKPSSHIKGKDEG